MSLHGNEILYGIEKLKRSTAIMLYANSAAQMLQNEMKATAPWQNRTGHARQRLNGKAYKSLDGKEVVIELSHGVDYGAYLELAHEKKYAVIEPTIRKKSSEVMAGFNNLMNKMK